MHSLIYKVHMWQWHKVIGHPPKKFCLYLLILISKRYSDCFMLFGPESSSKYLVFHRWKKVIQVCNNKRVSKRWQNFNFGGNYHFKNIFQGCKSDDPQSTSYLVSSLGFGIQPSTSHTKEWKKKLDKWNLRYLSLQFALNKSWVKTADRHLKFYWGVSILYASWITWKDWQDVASAHWGPGHLFNCQIILFDFMEAVR